MRRDRSMSTLHRPWLVPAVLAAASFGPACNGRDGPPTTDGPTEPATGTSSTPTTGGTTAAPTSTGSTGVGTTGAELPDCNLYDDDPVTCTSMVACLYLGDETEGECIVRCQNYTDQASCEMAELCYWQGGCYLAV